MCPTPKIWTEGRAILCGWIQLLHIDLQWICRVLLPWISVMWRAKWIPCQRFFTPSSTTSLVRELGLRVCVEMVCVWLWCASVSGQCCVGQTSQSGLFFPHTESLSIWTPERLSLAATEMSWSCITMLKVMKKIKKSNHQLSGTLVSFVLHLKRGITWCAWTRYGIFLTRQTHCLRKLSTHSWNANKRHQVPANMRQLQRGERNISLTIMRWKASS